MHKELIFVLLALAIVAVHAAKTKEDCKGASDFCEVADDKCCVKPCGSDGFCPGRNRNEACKSNKECLVGFCTDETCQCSEAGEKCKSQNQECCSTNRLTCLNGKCLSYKGIPCKADGECASGKCDSGKCSCSAAGKACKLKTNCCSGKCKKNGTEKVGACE